MKQQNNIEFRTKFKFRAEPTKADWVWYRVWTQKTDNVYDENWVKRENQEDNGYRRIKLSQQQKRNRVIEKKVAIILNFWTDVSIYRSQTFKIQNYDNNN